jgi:hypothetical protein
MVENEKDDKHPDGWNEIDIRSWEEFKKRIDSDRMVIFYPRARDLQFGRETNFSRSATLWFRSVFMPLPVDLFSEVLRWIQLLFRAFFMTGRGLFGGIIALLMILGGPLLLLIHRVMVTGCALVGRLTVVPSDQSVAEHLNYKMREVRREMEQDGYDLEKFYQEIDASEIDGEIRTNLMRRFNG